MFSISTYQKRRAKLRSEIPTGLILLLGNGDSPKNFQNNCYPFRQDSTFLYFTGLKKSDLALVIDVDSGEEFLFGDDTSIDHIVWTGPTATISELATSTGILQNRKFADLLPSLHIQLKKNRKIHYLPPYRDKNLLFLSNIFKSPADSVHKNVSQSLIKGVASQRNYKSLEELNEIEKAVNITVDMHIAAINALRPGKTEFEVVAEVTKSAINAGAELAFPPIATVQGQTLHNHSYNNTVQKGQLFLLDAGAETKMGYSGDLSSTFPVAGLLSPLQKDIYTICLESHDAAIAMLKPGVSFKDIYYQAARIIFEGMKSVGLAKGNTEDALQLGAHAMFFPCGLGHMLGLDVHDMEDLGENIVGWDGQERSKQFGIKSLRLARKLEPGFVLTIEPGIYFIPELIDQWQANNTCKDFLRFAKLEEFKTFGGIRNEEDFVITDDGFRLLGKQKPKRIEDLEGLYQADF